MDQPELPAESGRKAGGEAAPDTPTVVGIDNGGRENLPSEPPVTIDLVRMGDGDVGILRMQNGKGHARSAITHHHRVYRVPKFAGLPLTNIPLPHFKMEAYGTTRELFHAVQSVLSEPASCSEPAARLLTYWAFASWFADCFTFAPSLAITGPAQQADHVLLLLSYVCRFPLLLAAIGPGAFGSLPLEFTPTLLIREPELSKRMVALLRASNHRSYLMVASGGIRDLYCPKALYLGEHAPAGVLDGNTIRIELSAGSASVPGRGLPAWQSVLHLQTQLLRYRVWNAAKVANSSFDAAFSPEIRAAARVLGACIVDDTKLQADLLPLLAPQEERLGKRRKDLQATVLEALLLHCHEQQSKIFVRDITKTVNQIYRERGERLEVAVEEVGHKMKSLGLVTRRLGSAGRGLKLDLGTQALVHERAYAYHLLSPDCQDDDCHHCQRLQVIPEQEVVKGV